MQCRAKHNPYIQDDAVVESISISLHFCHSPTHKVSTQESNDTSECAKETTNVLNGFPMKSYMGLHEACTLMPSEGNFWAC